MAGDIGFCAGRFMGHSNVARAFFVYMIGELVCGTDRFMVQTNVVRVFCEKYLQTGDCVNNAGRFMAHLNVVRVSIFVV